MTLKNTKGSIIEHWVTIAVGILVMLTTVVTAAFSYGANDTRIKHLEHDTAKTQIIVERHDSEIVDIKILVTKFNATLERSNEVIEELKEAVDELKKDTK